MHLGWWLNCLSSLCNGTLGAWKYRLLISSILEDSSGILHIFVITHYRNLSISSKIRLNSTISFIVFMTYIQNASKFKYCVHVITLTVHVYAFCSSGLNFLALKKSHFSIAVEREIHNEWVFFKNNYF